MKLNEHFYKIILPNWVLAIVAISILALDFQWRYVLYAIMGFYLFGVFGGSIGFHRYLTHQSFKTSKFWHVLMVLFGSLMGQGSPYFWVGLHKFHHANSDKEADIHSPIHGRLNAFILWQIKHLPDIKLMANRSMYTDELIKFIHRNYYKFYWISAILVSIVGYFIDPFFGLFFMLFGGFFVVSIFENTGLVIFHDSSFGYNNFELGDNSRNVAWYAYLTMGGGWHNNHHFRPGFYDFGKAISGKWWEIDLSARFIDLIKTKS